MADANGEHTAAALGPVWANLPQTSQAGEVCGLAAARQLARGVAKKLYTDCMSVVRAAATAGAGWKRKAGFYAGVLRESEQEKGSEVLRDVEHVRSHQADSSEMLPSDLPQEEVVAISGNKAADEAATEALGMHPAFSEEPLAVSKKQFMMAKNVLLLAAKALPEWGAGKRGVQNSTGKRSLHTRAKEPTSKQAKRHLCNSCSLQMGATFGYPLVPKANGAPFARCEPHTQSRS